MICPWCRCIVGNLAWFTKYAIKSQLLKDKIKNGPSFETRICLVPNIIRKKSKLSKHMQRSILYKQIKIFSWDCHFLGHLFCKSGKDGATLFFAISF